MFKKQFLTIAMVALCATSFAQTVGVNTDGNPADPSALLDIRSSDKGMLIPRMDMTSRDAIASPATGLLIYQTDNIAGFYYNSGTPGSPVWTMISSSANTTGTQNGILVGQGVGNPSTFSAASTNANQVLATPTAGGAPMWVDPITTLPTSAVSGTGPVTITGTGDVVGGTGLAVSVEGTSGGVMFGQGAGISADFTAASANANEVLATPIAGGAPIWMNPNSLLATSDVTAGTGSSVVVSNGAGQVVGSSPVTVDVQGTQGGVLYGTGTGTAATFTVAGTAGQNQYLMSNGTAAPSFATPKEIFTVPLVNNFTTASGVAQGSAFAQSLGVNAGVHANYLAAMGQNLVTLLGFYSANQNVEFLGCSGWISVQNFIPSSYEVRIMKYSMPGTTASGTITGVEIASQLGINAGDASGVTAGKYNIDLTTSPVPLVPGDVLIMFVRNMQAGTARTHLSVGHAYFSKSVQ